MQTVSRLIIDRPLKVLTADLSARLTAANDARRALAARGLRVVNQHIHATARPLLRLEHGDERLRGQVRQIAFLIVKGERFLVGRFQEVDVAWPSPPAAH